MSNKFNKLFGTNLSNLSVYLILFVWVVLFVSLLAALASVPAPFGA